MGRLMHFVEDGKISLERVKYIVFDEADRMLDADGFLDQVDMYVVLS